jgi:hypothetical protein
MKHDLEQSGATSFACDCCGGTTRRVWGYLHSLSGSSTAYFVTWTQNEVASHGAFFDFVVGRWGDGTSPADRAIASLEFRLLESGPAFMVIDADNRGDYRSVATTTLSRTSIVGTPLAAQLYELADSVWLQDDRISELSGDGAA